MAALPIKSPVPSLSKGTKLSGNKRKPGRTEGADLVKGAKNVALCNYEKLSLKEAVLSNSHSSRNCPASSGVPLSTGGDRSQKSFYTNQTPIVSSARSSQSVPHVATTESIETATIACSAAASTTRCANGATKTLVEKVKGEPLDKASSQESVSRPSFNPQAEHIWPCERDCQISIVVHQVPHRVQQWSLFLDCGGKDNILSELLGQPGCWLYSEKTGGKPDPINLRSITKVANILVHEIGIYRHVVESTPMLKYGTMYNTRLWCMTVLLVLQQYGLINVDLLDLEKRAAGEK